MASFVFSTITDSVFDPTEPNWDGQQGWQGPPTALGQSIVPASGISVAEIHARICKTGDGPGNVYLEIMDGSVPPGTVLATSVSVPITSLPPINNTPADMNITQPLVAFSFSSPITTDGGAYVVTANIDQTVSGGQNPAWRDREAGGMAYPNGTGWTRNVLGWFQESHKDYELHIASTDVLTVRSTGFRFPYQKWT